MVDKISLENLNLEAARRLLTVLDGTEFRPTAFFWIFLPDQVWRLIIASNSFVGKPILESYQAFISAFRNNEDVSSLGMENITLLEPRHELIRLLKSAITTPPDSVTGIRLKANTIRNIYIEDAYIYRLT